MAWERRGWILYYYQKKRAGKSVLSKYVGRGSYAYEVYLEDLRIIKRRKDAIEAMKKEREDIDNLFTATDKIGWLTKHLIAVRMKSLGFHDHKGEWRRK
jgi:hypothetical protein